MREFPTLVGSNGRVRCPFTDELMDLDEMHPKALLLITLRHIWLDNAAQVLPYSLGQ